MKNEKADFRSGFDAFRGSVYRNSPNVILVELGVKFILKIQTHFEEKCPLKLELLCDYE